MGCMAGMTSMGGMTGMTGMDSKMGGLSLSSCFSLSVWNSMVLAMIDSLPVSS